MSLVPDAALYRRDRALVSQLLHADDSDSNVITACRLISRYFRSRTDNQTAFQQEMVTDLEAACSNWGLSINDAQGRARILWQSGWKPSVDDVIDVGSGTDTTSEAA